jgi:hypothetical protein
MNIHQPGTKLQVFAGAFSAALVLGGLVLWRLFDEGVIVIRSPAAAAPPLPPAPAPEPALPQPTEWAIRDLDRVLGVGPTSGVSQGTEITIRGAVLKTTDTALIVWDTVAAGVRCEMREPELAQRYRKGERVMLTGALYYTPLGGWLNDCRVGR